MADEALAVSSLQKSEPKSDPSSQDICINSAETLEGENETLRTELDDLRWFLRQQVKTYLHFQICQFGLILIRIGLHFIV